MVSFVRGILFSHAATVFGLALASTAATASPKAFSIDAEEAPRALLEFGRQSAVQILFASEKVKGVITNSVHGNYEPVEALKLLLKGTILVVSEKPDGVLVVEPQGKSHTTSRASTVPAADPDISARLAQAGTTSGQAPDSARNSTVIASPSESEQDKIAEIIVTGTHIRGVSMASPLIEIGREEIDRSGYTSVADLMLSLPQNFGGGYNPATMVGNSQININNADNPTGASVPNLRGLGSGSTLTLIDGHRMAAGLPAGGADISSIPIDAIDRIEVLTDSASAVYGSDAVAGVVNIILKRDYDGAKTSLSYGFAPAGGGTEKRASQMFGTHWDGGDVLIAYEHRQQDAVDARDRKFTSTALEPNSLLPQTNSNSVTLSATQELSAAASVFVDGLYIARDADSFSSSVYFPAPAESPATLRKYAVAAGFNFNLMRDWKATLFANAAEDDTESNSIFLTTPITMPRAPERLLGTMRSVEANANGGIATLSSGIVRLAVGAGYRKEGFSDAFVASSDTPAGVAADGNRNVRYVFGELSIPLVRHSQRPGLNTLDLIVSGRNERYSDFGAKTVPKIGLVYVPAGSIKLRSTWGKAFRAPNLYDAYGLQQLAILDLPSPVSSAGSPTLLRAGGNPNLQPELATAWSIGADYSPAESGLHVSTTLFDIKYTSRILSIANAYTALTDPLNAFFVTPSPSASLAQSVYDAYPPGQVFNQSSDTPFDPSKIGAIVDARMVNVASQTARGTDLSINYKLGAESNAGMLFFNGTYLDLTQQYTPQALKQTLSGLAFYPAKFRMRGGATWKISAWALTGTVNYLPKETNNQVTPLQNVGSWTTVDASLRFAPELPGVFSGIHFNLAVVNAFNRDPPFLLIPLTGEPGFNYDSSNTNPMGRFVSLQISKEW